MGEHTPTGQFCWWSLMSTDVERASRFYLDLITFYHPGNGGFANPVPLEENFPDLSHWINYITVKEVDQACQHAYTLGGTVCVPTLHHPHHWADGAL